MRNFSEFAKHEIVKKKKVDEARAESLVESAKERLEFVKTINFEEKNSKYIAENVYDVIRELIEAKLCLEGYKSYSHEATISYLKDLGFSEQEVKFVDELREVRHGIKYYGKDVGVEYARRVYEFLDSIYSRLKRLVGI